MQFEVTSQDRTSGCLLHISGELDVATVPQLRTAVQHALTARPSTLLLDLSGTRFIDSTGCRELVRSAKAGRAGGVVVEVVAPPDNWRIRRVLDLVQLSAVIPVLDAVPAQ